jgi:hypothetical protein
MHAIYSENSGDIGIFLYRTLTRSTNQIRKKEENVS